MARAVRADARQNRERILDVARQAFAEDGAVSMNQIAQRAGVGPGTLYRHYPSREALVLDVYRIEVARLVDVVPQLQAAGLAPREALRRWTSELVEAMLRKHGLGDALSPSAHQSITAETYGPVLGAITALLDAGKADGSFRADADPRDFLQLTGALWRAAVGTDRPGAEDRSQPMLELILDGLAARPPSSSTS